MGLSVSRPWITEETLEAVDQMAVARLAKDTTEWRRLCNVVRAKTKADGERCIYLFASDAEGGMSDNGQV